MDKTQLKDLIERTLKEIGLYSEEAVLLLLGTAAQESGFGKYIRQLGNGPALGVFQMEPYTHDDHVKNFLKFHPNTKQKILDACGVSKFKSEYLEFNLKYAVCMSRIHYRRVKQPLPNDLAGFAVYWKKYYNTYLGAGTTEEFIHNYKKYVL